MPNSSAEAWTLANGRVQLTWGRVEGDLVGILREKNRILIHLHIKRAGLTHSWTMPHGETLPDLIFVKPLALYEATAMTWSSGTQPCGGNALTIVRLFHCEVAAIQIGHHWVALGALAQLAP